MATPLFRAWGVLRLLRPLNVVMMLLGVAVGGLLGQGVALFEFEGLMRISLAMWSAACIGGAANAINDVLDLEIDRINRPDRPLPAGMVSVKTAQLVWALASALGLAGAVVLSRVHVVLAAGAVVLLLAYSLWLKQRPLVGNLVVAGMVALALPFGALAIGGPGSSWVGAGFAFLTILAREVVKDMEDVPGDATVGARTMPLVIGVSGTRVVALGIIALTIVLTPLPYLFLAYDPAYLMLVLMADALLLAVIWFLFQDADRSVHRASTLLKMAMLAGLIALAAA